MKIILSILIFFLITNIGIIYYLLFVGEFASVSQRISVIEKRLDNLRDTPEAEENPTQNNTESITLTKQQENYLIERTSALIEAKQSTSISDNENPQTSFGNINNGIIKEIVPKTYYLPLGRAEVSGKDNQWQNTNLEIDIKTADYPKIVSIRFEATMRMPNANGSMKARLVDVAAGPLQNSELTGEGKDGVYVKSNPIVISEGNKTLRVQLLTSIGDLAIIENSRIQITTD